MLDGAAQSQSLIENAAAAMYELTKEFNAGIAGPANGGIIHAVWVLGEAVGRSPRRRERERERASAHRRPPRRYACKTHKRGTGNSGDDLHRTAGPLLR
jgi:hypothetical protein